MTKFQSEDKAAQAIMASIARVRLAMGAREPGAYVIMSRKTARQLTGRKIFLPKEWAAVRAKYSRKIPFQEIEVVGMSEAKLEALERIHPRHLFTRRCV